jgi:hypothetical protein
MENQTRFDLNAAIENWRNELAAQPNLASDDRRELETHLRDAIAGFQQRGLNDEESFWLARKRVGQPHRLRHEYVKANPSGVWRERFFWTAVILLAIRAWTEISSFVCSLCQGIAVHILHNHHSVSPFIVWLSNSPTSDIELRYLSLLPVVGIIFLLACGKLGQRFLWIQNIFSSRRRFLFVSLPVFLVYFLLVGSAGLQYVSQPSGIPSSSVALKELMDLVYITLLIFIIAWLMPTQNRKTPKRA